MQIAVIGTGAIGSTFAFHLARGGHDVTVIARGARLAQLQAEDAIVTVKGQRAKVRVSPALDVTIPFDLVLVTVLAPQVEAVLPSLAECAAKTVMFMFNTFEPLGRLRDVVGDERFAFGFPAVLATLHDGKLKSQVYGLGQITTVTHAEWAKTFAAAGIPTVVHADIHSWLRTHAAFIMPFMALGAMVHARGGGITWAESRKLARAMSAGFDLVRSLGNQITPLAMGLMSHVPDVLTTLLIWILSRTKMLHELGAMGPGEARMLIDMMEKAAPDGAAALVAVRP
jgi:2-dehydropantoate 2-reductase